MIKVQAIPFKSFKEKIQKVKELENKGYRVTVYDEYVYGEKVFRCLHS